MNPGCKPTAAGGGNWNDIDFGQNLHFKGLTIQVVDCGNVPGHNGSNSPKSPFSFIEFQGVGTLKGIAGIEDAGIIGLWCGIWRLFIDEEDTATISG